MPGDNLPGGNVLVATSGLAGAIQGKAFFTYTDNLGANNECLAPNGNYGIGERPGFLNLDQYGVRSI